MITQMITAAMTASTIPQWALLQSRVLRSPSGISSLAEAATSWVASLLSR